jgi:hypothetical protein
MSKSTDIIKKINEIDGDGIVTGRDYNDPGNSSDHLEYNTPRLSIVRGPLDREALEKPEHDFKNDDKNQPLLHDTASGKFYNYKELSNKIVQQQNPKLTDNDDDDAVKSPFGY